MGIPIEHGGNGNRAVRVSVLVALVALVAGCASVQPDRPHSEPADPVGTRAQLPPPGSDPAPGGTDDLPFPLPAIIGQDAAGPSSQPSGSVMPGAHRGDPGAAVELPGGGTRFFPGRRLVALYGHPGAPGLGALGEQGPDAAIARVQKLAAQYGPLSDVPVVPTFEIIATVAHQAPGQDGDFSGETPADELRPWIDKARAAGVYVLLDLQPGRADLLDQARMYTDLLQLPNVGLAVDPEWKLQPGQLPLHQVGHLDAGAINALGDWLDGITGDDLPQKLLVVHQFQDQMVRGEDGLVISRPHVQTLVHMDGQGAPAVKNGTWDTLTQAVPGGMPLGWKNFFRMDAPMLTPEQTMSHRPQPLMISYQ